MLLDTDTVMDAALILLEVAIRDQIEDRTDTDYLYDLPENYRGDIHRFIEDVRTKEGEAIAYLMGKYVGAIRQAWGIDVGLVFHHMGLPGGSETEIKALYRLIMSCWGHGVSLDDDHSTGLDRAREILKLPLPTTPCRFDDSEFKDRILGDHLVCTQVKWIVKDWAGNRMFPDKEFDDFESGWGYVREQIPDEDAWQDIYVERQKE